MELQYNTQNITLHNLLFVLTCSACPEQYDVYKDKKQVGYVRLRHGWLRCFFPSVESDNIIFEEQLSKDEKGCFYNSKERKHYLNLIAKKY